MNRAPSRTAMFRRGFVGVAVVGFVGLGMIEGITVAQGAATNVTASQVQPLSAPTATPTASPNNLVPVAVEPPISPRKPLAAGWVVLAVAAAGVIALGLYRVPDQVLQSAGPACRLEDS